MHLRELLLSPPGGFHYKQPQSGLEMAALNFGTLLKQIRQHRTNMNYPAVTEGFVTLGAEIEQAICEALSPANQASHCEMGVRTRKAVHWTETVASIATVAAAWALQGFKQVPQEQANARALVCSTCPFNVVVNGCGPCRTAVKEAREHLFKASTPHDSRLKSCSACGCDLKMIAHVPLDVLQAGGDHSFPSWCWRATN